VCDVKRAVFFDRDGTLIELVHYLRDPADVRLEAGAGAAMHELQRLGYALVMITNQSAIGRGLLTEEGLDEIHAELNRQLAVFDVRLDGIYHCPLAPKQKGQTVIEHPDRKPGPGMLLRACSELGLEAADSWMIGDSLSDLLAGRNARCKGSILVRTGYGDRVDAEAHGFRHVAKDLVEAAGMVAELDGVSAAEA
jgi:D-glycero-D-manno-heptose 1,7-bisphosphate phosphatase